jgi:drug/metabolite transporter (DMT)-like permease
MTAIRRRSLLGALILTWGVSWPVIKVGIATVPPIWFGTFRYLIAAGTITAWVAARRELAVPPRSDWSLVAVSGTLQMGAYSALTGIALVVLPPGRASVLAFSTPIWVVPLAAWWLHEHLPRLALCGVGLGLAGVFVISGPALRTHEPGHLLAYGLLIGAAGGWAISIVFVRGHRFASTALALAPWQMLVASLLLLPLAILVEGKPPAITGTGVASLAYVGPIATAFAYWAVVEAGRQFPANTMSMALLAAPTIGILISAVTLGETVGASLIGGSLLVGGGILLTTVIARRNPHQPASAALPEQTHAGTP